VARHGARLAPGARDSRRAVAGSIRRRRRSASRGRPHRSLAPRPGRHHAPAIDEDGLPLPRCHHDDISRGLAGPE
jgi:hypothetical protein